ncbi:MAG: tRNA (guanosine(37)-N1)-methyltransferase TrmD [Bacillota bacterium]
MKRYTVLTLFPEMILETLGHSMMGRAQKKNIISVEAVNIRDFTHNKHLKVDEPPYGGGVGMVMQAPPIYDAYDSIEKTGTPRVLYMTPQGKPFTQKMAEEFSKEDHLIFLCGHYEGIDERVIEEIVTDEISLGDFVLTGGELPAIAMIDSIARLVEGVLGKAESFQDESFQNDRLEYPQYTRPAIFRERGIPDILLSGHHKNIELWRAEQSLLRTAKKRPDLLKNQVLTEKEITFLATHGILIKDFQTLK